MSRPQYEVLIVGCGNIAGGFDALRSPELPPLSHAGAFTKHGGFRLRACVEPDDDRRRRFAERWGVEAQAAEVATLNAAPGTFDVISICSPTSVHHEHLAQALELRPKLIFCEKPLTSDESSAVHLVEACHSQGVTLVVNYSRRWDPSVAELIRDLQSGRWGRVRSIVAHYNKGILNNGGHIIELLLRLLGPMEVVATACPKLDFWESDPTVAALLTADGGAIPVYLNPADARDYAYFELEIICSLGSIRMQSGGMSWQFREVIPSLQFAGYRSLDVARQVDGRYQETMSLAVKDIHDHLSVGTAVGSSDRDALQVQKLCLKIQRMAFAKCHPHNKTEVIHE